MQTIDRTIDILNVVSTSASGLTLTELSRRLGLPKTTAYRILQVLVKHDFLRKDDLTKVYRLGPALVTLGANSLQQWDLRSLAHPYLEKLAHTSNETVCLIVLFKDKAICLDTIESDRRTSFIIRVGRDMEFHCSAAGKAIIAFLPAERIAHILYRQRLIQCTPNTITDVQQLMHHFETVRAQGYALCDAELEVGVRALAAPVMQNDRQVLGSVAIVAPAERLDQEARERLLPQLLETVRRISMELGYHPSVAPT